MEFTITPVERGELDQLLGLILELARFEKLEHEVQTTVELLEKSMFGPTPAAGALLAKSGRELAGYAIYYFTFSTFVGKKGIWLEDVYVRPPFRKQGLGRRLMEEVARVGVSHDCGRFEWTALNWNKTALDFYDKLGAKSLNEWVLLRLDAEGLRALAVA
jgi:GNAT superfamily N-acetyltransferase